PVGTQTDWRPYRFGHWVYTDEWGWYWIADEEWGWIAYHYGRWILDREFGWIWVPGDEWSPAWVRWRRGETAIGWSPMPPDDVIQEVEADPQVWLFVEPSDLVVPSLATYILPPERAVVFVRETVVVNQTIILREKGHIVCANPGVPPSYIAAKIG